MSSLSEKLKDAQGTKRETTIEKWLKGLDEVDRKSVWEALRDENVWKTYSLLNFLRDQGDAPFGKESFVPFRRAVLNGEITEEQVHGSK